MSSKADTRPRPKKGESAAPPDAAQRYPPTRSTAAGLSLLDASVYREMVEASPHGLLVHRDYLPLHANGAFARLLGFESPAVLVRSGSLLARFAAPQRESLIERARTVRSGGEAVPPVDIALQRVDGGQVTVRMHTRRIAWESSTAMLETLTDVTELRRAQAKLVDHNARMRLAQQQAKLTYWRWSFEENRMTHWSEDWEGIMGRPFDGISLDYKAMLGHIHPDDRERVMAEYAAADEQQRGFQVGFRLLRSDGVVRHVSESAEVEYDDAGQPIGQIGFVQDVDEARRTEMALLQSEARYRAFLANSSEGVWRIEQRPPLPTDLPVAEQVEWLLTNATFAECNDVMARMHGCTDASGLLGLRVLEVMPAANTAVRELLRQFVDSGYRLVRQRSASRSPAGAMQFFDNSVTGVSENGFVTSIWGTQADVTELVQAERALRTSEQRFRDFAETAADWFWETDANGRMVFISEEFDARSGLRAADFLQPGDTGTAAATAPWIGCLADASEPGVINDAEVKYTDSGGERRIARISAKPVRGRDGVFVGYRGSGIDITEASALSDRLVYQAAHDALTGLVGRGEFERRLGRLLESTRGTDGEHALCYVDLDRFKIVNDTCGHVAGDVLLRQLAAVLRHHARHRDTLARLGGDEFALLLEHCALDAARRVANELREAVADFRFAWEDKTFRLGASIGLVRINHASGTASDVLRAVDAACYTAKDEGRNRVHVHHDDDHHLALRVGQLQWIDRINRAIEHDGFVLHAQPIIAAGTGAATPRFSELLLRMVGEDGELTLPGAFLPAAERYGLAVRIDRWVVDTALAWIAAEPTPAARGDLHFVNLSGQSLGDEAFLAFVIGSARRHGTPLGRVCFEVTETAAIANLASATNFISVLSAQGCRFALDDFGSGLSSFAYLKNLPVDFLKIDGAFVRDLLTDPIDLEMVKSINDIGHVMGKRTIAESVESADTLARLAEIGVDYAQGFGIARPLPLKR